MFAVGIGGALEGVTPSNGSEAQDAREVRDRLSRRRAGAMGIALFMASPTIATGAAILSRTKKHIAPRNTRLSFTVTPRYAGLSLTGRF